MPPAYEVVVPTHGVERTIAATLESLLTQTHRPARVLVADDASPDRSVEVARRFEGVEVVSFEHSGLSGVQNRALEHVRADLYANVDGDDIWHPETGRLLAAAFEATDAGAISVQADRFLDGTQPSFPTPLPPVWTEVGYDALLARNTLIKSGTMYRTAAVRQVGGWREDLPILGDHDIALRILEAGHPVFATDWQGVGLRVAPSTMSRNPAPTLVQQLEVALPRLEGPAAARQARALWVRTLARAADDGRDLRDVPPLTELAPEAVPPGQRVLDAVVHSPLRRGLVAARRLQVSRRG